MTTSLLDFYNPLSFSNFFRCWSERYPKHWTPSQSLFSGIQSMANTKISAMTWNNLWHIHLQVYKGLRNIFPKEATKSVCTWLFLNIYLRYNTKRLIFTAPNTVFRLLHIFTSGIMYVEWKGHYDSFLWKKFVFLKDKFNSLS